MPILDMPIEELLEYKGINPRPADHDEYWARALAELDTQSLEYTLEPVESGFKGVCLYHLTFIGVGGAKIHCNFLTPEKMEGELPAIAAFHGYQGLSSDWFDNLAYVYNGFVVAAMDVRGQGGLSQDTLQTVGSTVRGHIVRGLDDENPDNLMFRNIFLDTAHIVRILQSMPFVDAKRIGARGSSQGGALTIACAALEPSVKAVSFCCPFLSDYKRTWEMDLSNKQEPYREIYLYFRNYDPMHQNEDKIWEKLGYIDIQNLAGRIKAKCLFFTGLIDEVCPPSTQFATYNKITAPKEIKIYPEYAHEVYPMGNHYTLEHFINSL